MHLCVILLGGVALVGGLALADDGRDRERRSSYPQQQNQHQQPVATYQQQDRGAQTHQEQNHLKQDKASK